MDHSTKMQYQEAKTLVETLHHDLVTLAASLRGQLVPDEENILANIFQAQVNLQLLIDEVVNNTASPMPPELSPDMESELNFQRLLDDMAALFDSPASPKPLTPEEAELNFQFLKTELNFQLLLDDMAKSANVTSS